MERLKCPLCFVKVPWTAVLVQSYEIGCPACRALLEMSRYTRIVGGFVGIAGAIVAAQLATVVSPRGFWVTRMVAAILGYSVISAMCVVLVGDLVVRPKDTPAAFPHPAK